MPRCQEAGGQAVEAQFPIVALPAGQAGDVTVLLRGGRLRLKQELDDSSLPFRADLVCCSTLDTPELKSHSTRVGQALFESAW